MWKFAVFCACLCDVTARSILDLSHTFDENAPKYPLTGFGIENLTYYNLRLLDERWHPNGMWLSLKKIEFYEHMGTHLDAPFHFGAGRQTIDQIPPERLVGPGVIINVRDKVVDNPNYGVTVNDIKEYEAKYGMIPNNAIVIMNSGWAEKYDNSNLVFGTSDLSNSSSFNFPGWSIEACIFLLNERRVSVVGVDTPSTDPANLGDYPCHRYLQPNQVPLLEYAANLDTMPPAGSTIVLGAMKHRGGTGGQVRVLAIIDDDDNGVSEADAIRISFARPLMMIVLFLFLCKQ